MLDALIKKITQFATKLGIENAIPADASQQIKLSKSKDLINIITSKIAPFYGNTLSWLKLRLPVEPPEPHELETIYTQYQKLNDIADEVESLFNKGGDSQELVDIKNELVKARHRLSERLAQHKTYYHDNAKNFIEVAQSFFQSCKESPLYVIADYQNLLIPVEQALLNVSIEDDNRPPFEYVTKLLHIQQHIRILLEPFFSLLETWLFKVLHCADTLNPNRETQQNLDLTATDHCQNLRELKSAAINDYYTFLVRTQKDFFDAVRQKIEANAATLDSLESLVMNMKKSHSEFMCKSDLGELLSLRTKLIQIVYNLSIQYADWDSVLMDITKFDQIAINLAQLQSELSKECIDYELEYNTQWRTQYPHHSNKYFNTSPIIHLTSANLYVIPQVAQLLYTHIENIMSSLQSEETKLDRSRVLEGSLFKAILQNTLLKILAMEFYPGKYSLLQLQQELHKECTDLLNKQYSLYKQELDYFKELLGKINEANLPSTSGLAGALTMPNHKINKPAANDNFNIIIDNNYQIQTARMLLKKKVNTLEKYAEDHKIDVDKPLPFISQFAGEIDALRAQLNKEKIQWWSPNKNRKEKKIKFLENLRNEATFANIIMNTEESDEVLAGVISNRVRTLFFKIQTEYVKSQNKIYQP